MPMVRKRRKIKKILSNLEKQRRIQGQLQKIKVKEKEISDEKRINEATELFIDNCSFSLKNSYMQP